MADQSPEEIHLKHIRAPDYKEISADGTLHKIVDNHLVITFYIEDSRVTGEVLRRDGQDPPTYESPPSRKRSSASTWSPCACPPRPFSALPQPSPSASPSFRPRQGGENPSKK